MWPSVVSRWLTIQKSNYCNGMRKKKSYVLWYNIVNHFVRNEVEVWGFFKCNDGVKCNVQNCFECFPDHIFLLLKIDTKIRIPCVMLYLLSSDKGC